MGENESPNVLRALRPSRGSSDTRPLAFRGFNLPVGSAYAGRERRDGVAVDAPAPVGPFLNGIFPLRTPLAPGSSPWEVVPAFPNLPLVNVLVSVPNPADERLYVASRDGLIVSFENDEQVATSEPFMDLRDRVAWSRRAGCSAWRSTPTSARPGRPTRAASMRTTRGIHGWLLRHGHRGGGLVFDLDGRLVRGAIGPRPPLAEAA